MEEFYKKLNDKLENTPNEPTDWSVWDKIENELDRDKKRAIIPFWFWPLGMLAVGLLGYMLGSEMPFNIPSNERTTLVRDTIYMDRIITKSDTVFQHTSLTENPIFSNLNAENQRIQNQLQALKLYNRQIANQLNSYGRLIAEKGLLADIDFSKLPNIQDFESFASKMEVANSDIFPKEKRDFLNSLEFLDGIPISKQIEYDRKRPMPIVGLTHSQILKMMENPSFMDKITPDYVNIGFLTEGPSFIFDQNGNSGSAFGGGGIVELIFSPKLSLILGASSVSYSSKIEDETNAGVYPQPMNIGEDEIFENLNILSSSLEIPVSLKYRLNFIKSVQPYIVGGLSGVKFRNIEYKYEYSSGTNETYYEVSANAVLPWGWSVHGGLSAVKSISNSFDILGEVRFNYQLGDAALNRDRYYGLGIRLGALYKI